MSGNPWNQTFSGLAFDLLDPLSNMVSIKDIAHALSNQCRFNGHCKRFYSVAEHCVYVSRVVPKSLRYLALLHDAAETYTNDITRPLKSILPDFRDVESRIWQVVAHRLNLPREIPEEIHVADQRLLATESEYLMSPSPRPWLAGVAPYDLREIGLRHPNQFGLLPRDAHRLFLERFAELSILEGRS